MNRQSQLTPATGAYTDLNHLIRLRLNAKDIQLLPQKKALSSMTGPNRTHFRGRGIDFSEVRVYQPGDDIRNIDWRVTARSGKPHTKLYQEERERPVIISVDQSTSMFFGSQYCFKSVLAAELGSYIAWAALNNGDRVGGSVFSDGYEHHEVKPKRSHHSVLQLIKYIHQANQQLSAKAPNSFSAPAKLASATKNLMQMTRPGSAIFLISDFSDFNEACEKHLYQLSQHNDVTCLYTYDAMEQQLPPAGQYAITNGVDTFNISTHQAATRQAYQNQFDEKLATLQNRLGRMGVHLIPVATHESPLAVLTHFFSSASKRKKR